MGYLHKSSRSEIFVELNLLFYFTKIKFGKIFTFFAEKKLFEICDAKIFIFFCLKSTQCLNVLKISSPEIYKGYLSNLQKHIPAKYLKKISVKIMFLGKDFICSLNFLIQMGF